MSFVAQITADISNFDKNIKKATDIADSSTKKMQAQFDKLGDSFVKVGAKASILSTAIIGATVGIVKLGIDAGNASAEINNLSTATSLSTDLIQELSYVATASNSSFEGLQSSMDSFQRRLKTVGEEGSRVNEMFGKLGVSTTDASGNVKSMDDVLLETFNKLGDMENGLAKNAIGSELFGRSWNEVSLIVSSGSKGIAELREEANKLGLVLDENTLQSSDDFATAMELVGFQLDKLKTKIGASLVPILQETVLPLLEDKIIPAVSKFADNIAELSEKFNALSPATKNAILAITGIAAAIGPLLLGLGGLLKILPLIGAGFTAMTGPIGIAVMAITAAATLIITHWDEIKAASNNVVEYVKDDWERLKESLSVTSSSIGKLMKGDFNGWMDDVKKSFDLTIDYLKNRWEQLRGIFKGDGSAQSGIALGGLGVFVELPAVLSDSEKEVIRLRAEIERLKNLLANAGAAADNLAQSQEKVVESLKAMRLVIPQKEIYSLFNELFTQSGNELILNPVIEPNIDSATLKSKMYESVKGAMGDLSEGIKVISIDLSGMLTDLISGAFASIGDAIVSGDNIMASLGASLLGTLGGLLVQLGEMAIGVGIGLKAIKEAFKTMNPFVAIAAGAALVALGSMFSAGSRKLSQSMGGGGYSGTSSMQNSQPTLGNSDYRGAYQDDFRVEFKIGSNELVGVLDTANQRRNRLG
jgi:uncharacterized coiled-coil protein SlyX